MMMYSNFIAYYNMGAHISKLVVCSALLTYGVTPGVMAKGSTGTGRLARYLTDAGSFPSIRQGVESTRPIPRPLTYDGPKNFPHRNNIRGRLLTVHRHSRCKPCFGCGWGGGKELRRTCDSDTSNGPESATNGLSSDSPTNKSTLLPLAKGLDAKGGAHITLLCLIKGYPHPTL